MALKVTEIRLNDRGTDKTFIIKEMSCIKLQKWLMKAVATLGNTGLLNLETGAFASIMKTAQPSELTDTAQVINAIHRAVQDGDVFEKLSSINCDKVDELLLEMLSSCEYKLDATYFPLTAGNIETYIEDIKTLVALEREAFKLNLGFFDLGNSSISRPALEGKTKGTSKPKISTP